MAKTLYEGYRIGKDGVEKWSGTIHRQVRSGQFAERKPDAAERPRKTPKGGSVVISTRGDAKQR